MFSIFISLCLCSSCQLSSTRRSSGDSQREDERRSRTGGHRSDGHRPVSEFWVDELKWFLLSAPLSFIILPFLPPQVGFDSIGGLWGHISALKEMVVFPLLYPEVFDNFKIQPPRFIYYMYIHVNLLYKFCILHTTGSISGVNNNTSPIYWCMRGKLCYVLQQ